MMRPFSLLCMLLAVVSGLYLYRVKYRAQMLDQEINATLKSADEARARAALLRADYALLNDPVRLQELVDSYLPLKTTQPTQFTTLADFERRLPPIGIAPPEPPPEPEIPAAVMRPEPRSPVPEPKQVEPKQPEPRVAEPKPEPPRPPVVAVARPAPPPAAVSAPPAAQAAAPAPPRPAPAPVVATAPRPPTPLGLPPLTQVAVRAAPPPSAPAPAAAPYRPAPPPAPIPVAAPATLAPAASAPGMTRSALGMARRATPSVMAPGGGGGN